MSTPPRVFAPAGVAAGVLACLLGCAEAELAGGAERSPPPIVLVSVDTLRSDRLALYDPEGVPTPALAALRSDGTLYSHAFAPVPLTLPSHVTALTGLLPARHAVRDNGGFRFEAARHPYVPRRLKEAGYATGAFVSTFVLRGNSGLEDGFDVYDDELETGDGSPFGTLQRPGDETIARALAWLEGVRERPFFLFLHLYEPHLPYSAPPEFAARFADPYAAEIAYADSLLDGFFARLRDWGLYDRALIVFMSDHGEGLGDHGYQEHGLLLYREALQVPLIVKKPAGADAGRTVEAPVQLADLAPTLERWAGIEAADAERDGIALDDAASGEPRALLGETFMPRFHYGWSELGSVIELPHHLIWGPDPELYDLVVDPAETKDLFDSRPDVARALARARRDYDWSVPRPAAEDAETLANLEALGYLGGAGEAADSVDPSSIDPKARLELIDELNHATSRFRRGERQEAVEEFRRIVREAPEIIDAWESLGKSLLQMGRATEAVAALEEAMRRSGGRPLVALALANALWHSGDLEGARRHAEIAAPTQDLAHGLLAQIALKQGRLGEARTHVERALDVPPIRDQALLTRAEIELEGGSAESALTALEAIADPALQALELVRGRALAGLGRAAEAEAAFRRQIETHPDILDGYTYLAYFYSLRGDGVAAGRALQAMVETNPTPAAYAAAVNTLRLVGDPASAERLLGVALRRWPGAPPLLRLKSPA